MGLPPRPLWMLRNGDHGEGQGIGAQTTNPRTSEVERLFAVV